MRRLGSSKGLQLVTGKVAQFLLPFLEALALRLGTFLFWGAMPVLMPFKMLGLLSLDGWVAVTLV